LQPVGREAAAAVVAAAAEATGAGGVAVVEGAELRAVAQPVILSVSFIFLYWGVGCDGGK